LKRLSRRWNVDYGAGGGSFIGVFDSEGLGDTRVDSDGDMLPWASVSIRRSPGFAWMALALIGMTWRAESWKLIYLELEREVLELKLPQPPPILSNAKSFSQDQPFRCDALWMRCHPLVSLDCSFQLSTHAGNQAAESCLSGFQVLRRSSHANSWYTAQHEHLAEAAMKYHTHTAPTPVRGCCLHLGMVIRR
jgi:hypothetical protein